jgi:acyl-CoA synthetase (AMP-forming)/AMP-acid ligase II
MYPRTEVQPALTIPEVLARAREVNDPGAPALSFYAGRKCQVRWSWAEYLGAIDGWADLLRRAGVQAGDRVATLLLNRPEVPALYLGALSLGAVIVPLNPRYSPAESRHVVGETEPKVLLTDRGTVALNDDSVEELCEQVIWLDEVELDPAAPPETALSGDAPALVLYTSGTTAFPKGVVHMHRNLVANAWSMVRVLGIERPVQYSVMPFYHSHAVGFGMTTCLLTSGHLVMAERMDPLAWPTVIAAEGVTVTSMVPTMLALIHRRRVKASDLPTLRFVFVSAAPLPSELARQFEQDSGLPLVHAWGLSEFTNFATALPPETETELREELMFGHETPCVGSELGGVEVEVVRDDGSRADPSEPGELQVRGPSMTAGYFEQPDATTATFRDGWIHTGDTGYYVEAGGKRFFFIAGRIKDVIIRGGENISPGTVEAAIESRCPQLAGSLVALGFPHDVYGEEIGLVVDTADGGGAANLLASVIADLPVRLRPKIVLWGPDCIPRTHTGKTQRRMLVDNFAAYRAGAGAGSFVPLVPGRQASV